MAQDAAMYVLNLLQNDDEFCALVSGGAANILCTGDMLVTVLHNSEITRRDTSATGVLAVSVQDAGEMRQVGDIFRQSVVVRGLDRLNGFSAIRSVREKCIELIDGVSVQLDEAKGGIISITYQSRSGHRVDRTYNVDFESTIFTATVQYAPREA